MPLPGYSFQRKRYWVTPDAPGEGRPRPAAAAAGAGGGFYAPGWKRLPARPAGAPGAAGTAWAVLGAELGLGRELASELAAAGATVARVSTGDELISGPGAAWSLDVTRREHYARLIKELDAGRMGPVWMGPVWMGPVWMGPGASGWTACWRWPRASSTPGPRRRWRSTCCAGASTA